MRKAVTVFVIVSLLLLTFGWNSFVLGFKLSPSSMSELAKVSPAINLTASQDAVTIEQGNTGVINITVHSASTHDEQINLTLTPLDQLQNTTAYLTPTKAIVPAHNASSITLVIVVGSDSPASTHYLQVSGNVTGAVVQPITITLKVTQRTDYFLPFVAAVLAVAVAVAVLLISLRRPREFTTSASSVAVATYIGQRESNEDSACAIDASSTFRSHTRRRVLLVLADGMGGYRSGDVASSICVKTIVQYITPFLQSNISENFQRLLFDAVQKANQSILDSARELRQLGMGATVVACIIDGPTLYVIWAGDSRAYLSTPTGLSLLTRDHTKVMQLVDSGQLSPGEARFHPERNIVTRSVGRRDDPNPEYKQYTLTEAPSTILLCSDGLSEILEDKELATILGTNSAKGAARRLIQISTSRRSSDNVTVAIAALTRW